MALVRYLGDEVAAKAYLFDVFYHKNNRNFVMLTIFFDTWPEILLWTGTTTSVLNPLLETIVWAIYNTGPPNSLAELKVNPSAFSENICDTSCYKNTDSRLFFGHSEKNSSSKKLKTQANSHKNSSKI